MHLKTLNNELGPKLLKLSDTRKERKKQFTQNGLFESDRGKFLDELEGVGTSDETPDQEEREGFWRRMWGQSSDHNEDAEWLKELKSEIRINRQGNISITKESVARYVKSIPNWKAPGPDLVQGFWLIKHFSSLHQRISHQLQDCLLRGHVPKWMTRGRAVLNIQLFGRFSL